MSESTAPVRPGPTVSVILVSYNQGRYLRSAVESVLGQTFDDFELLVVDNGSTDGSQELLAEFGDDPRIHLMLFPEHGNLGVRFNQGVDASRGEFISFLYSDDYYLPHKLERQVERFRSLPDDYGVVYAAAKRVNESTGETWVEPGPARSGDVFEHFLRHSHKGSIEMISPMTRRSCFIERRFDERVFFESEGIFFRIALNHKFSYMPEPLTVARDHAGNGGKAIRRNLEIVTDGMLTQIRHDPHLRDDQRPLIDRYEAGLLRRYGWIGVRVSPDMEWTRQCFLGSIRKAPINALHIKTIIGLALTYLPSPVRRQINRFGYWLRRGPEQAVYVEDYEGLLTEAHAAGP